MQEEKKEERLIVGLGNPESEFADTRHNLGFTCVRELARRLGAPINKKRWRSLAGRAESHGVWFVLPQTYMNLSGQAVAKALKDTGLTPAQTWVVYDELDLPLCRMRIRRRGSGAGPGRSSPAPSREPASSEARRCASSRRRRSASRTRCGSGSPGGPPPTSLPRSPFPSWTGRPPSTRRSTDGSRR